MVCRRLGLVVRFIVRCSATRRQADDVHRMPCYPHLGTDNVRRSYSPQRQGPCALQVRDRI